MPGPMDGVKVVEIGVWIAAPAAGGILADWGADVIKIESVARIDMARRQASRPGGAGRRAIASDINYMSQNTNCNKRSI